MPFYKVKNTKMRISFCLSFLTVGLLDAIPFLGFFKMGVFRKSYHQISMRKKKLKEDYRINAWNACFYTLGNRVKTLGELLGSGFCGKLFSEFLHWPTNLWGLGTAIHRMPRKIPALNRKINKIKPFHILF